MSNGIFMLFYVKIFIEVFMKNTGVVRKIDDLGRIVIPKEIRKSLNIRNGEDLQIFVDNDNIVLKKIFNFSFLMIS